LKGVEIPRKAAPPVDLAEAWFEAQESHEQALVFEKELHAALKQRRDRLQALEQRFDDQGDLDCLRQLADGVAEMSYLDSMRRDLETRLSKAKAKG
jgi:uncharacterized protein with gpF-like domain